MFAVIFNTLTIELVLFKNKTAPFKYIFFIENIMYFCHMERIENDKIIYDKNVIDFVTVSVEFCAILEGDEILPRTEWIDRMLKILPLLYLKASLLPETVASFDEMPEIFVQEEDYSRVELRVSEIMGEEDIYLDVFIEDMKYSDRPISAFISENIADVYQDIRNFISVYQFELTSQMESALEICTNNFKSYWGQKLINVLRPLHALLSKENDVTDGSFLNQEEQWD